MARTEFSLATRLFDGLFVAVRMTVGFSLALIVVCACARGQDNADCFTCHDSKTLTMKRGGQIISLDVSAKQFPETIHGAMKCVACHGDLAGKPLPHGVTPERPSCGACHAKEQAQYDQGLHGTARARREAHAPSCADCHSSHSIYAIKDPRSPVAPIRIPFVCGKCHREGSPVQRQFDIPEDRILENYSESMHGEALLKKGLTVTATCVSCHTAHLVLPHTDPRSSIARKNIAATCTKCHAAISEVHRKLIRGELWQRESNVLPACPDCHQPHKVRKVFYDEGIADQDCLTCHARKGLKAKADGRSLTVDVAVLARSRHATRRCSECHSQVRPSLNRPCSTISHPVDCGACHTEVATQYRASIHGRLAARNDPDAPTCVECHGSHEVMGRHDPASLTFPRKVPSLCGRCHREGETTARRYKGTQHEITANYAESIHGKGLIKSGLLVTAMCTDCHTAHHVLPASDPASSVNSGRLPQTCGRCHDGIMEQFEKSIHSVKISKSKKPLPVCADCHTAHRIARTDSAGFRLEVMATCGKCHREVAQTYFDTYHGKVSQLGYAKTAKCQDCHGSHDILPVSDPRSHLSRDNVVKTCRQCHPGATRRFAGYLTHATHHDPVKYPILFWTFWGMTGLLIGTFVVGTIHTLLWLPRALEMRRAYLAVAVAQETGKQYVRFRALDRILHAAMIVSFMSLAVTGLTLKFSFTHWAVAISRFLGGFEVAGDIHRMAALLMIAICTAHLYDLFRRARQGKRTWRDFLTGPNSMLPMPRDFREFIDSLKWFLGWGPRPRYGRWTYWEKFDYFAVFWGMLVIGPTGLMLWFPELFTRVVPGLVINVATIVHSDEALLAVGFIFTIHFFNTHLRPEKFPMDLVVFTGRMSVEEFKRDKPAEYEALIAAGDLERHLADPYPSAVVRTARMFAWGALAVGFGIVVWIVYAMVFAYR